MSRRSTELCSVDGCNEAFYSLALCRNHHANLKRNGHPTAARLKYCEHCGGPYRTTSNNRFCSERCRFLSKVDKSPGLGPNGDCWEWTGTRHGKGYGHFRPDQLLGRTVEKAQRVAFRLFCNHDPGDLQVCHACDNPPCVNPSHLFLGSNAVNLLDRQNKKRQAYGERSGNAVLTEKDVREIRQRKDVSLAELSRKFSVSHGTVRHAAYGMSWSHMNPDFPPWERTPK